MKLKLVQWFKRSNIPYMILIAVGLLSLYGFTISSYIAAAPSEGFSREVEIDTVQAGTIKTIRSHVETIELSDNKLLIVAVDGHKTKLITIDEKGQVVDRHIIDLDMFKSTNISVTLEDNHLQLYYVTKDLMRADIDLNSYSFSEVTVEEDVRSFKQEGDFLVLEKTDGLYGKVIGSDNGKATKPTLLVNGSIVSYELAISNDELNIVTTVKNGIAVDVRYLKTNRELAVVDEFTLYEKSGSSYIKNVNDIIIINDELHILFVWSDVRFGSNYLTMNQVNLETKQIESSFRKETSMHRSKFVIQQVNQDSYNIIMQDYVQSSINIVIATIGENISTSVKPLTKTRKLSMLSSYIKKDNDERLVFADLSNDNKIIYFATSNPEVIKATTRVTTINPIRILWVTLVVLMQSVYIGIFSYAIVVALPPFVFLLIINKITPTYKYKMFIHTGIAVIAHTIAKLYRTYHLLNIEGAFPVSAKFIGTEPIIYVVMILTSIVSVLIMLRYIKLNRQYDSTELNSYWQFMFIDFVQYILLIFIYSNTALIINQI